MAFPVSDEFIVWAQSLSDLLTKMRTEFGSMPEMVEGPGWDEGRTHYALSLVRSLTEQLSKVEEDVADWIESEKLLPAPRIRTALATKCNSGSPLWTKSQFRSSPR